MLTCSASQRSSYRLEETSPTQATPEARSKAAGYGHHVRSRRSTPTTKYGFPKPPARGWLVITRDRHIQDHRAEIEAVRSSSARMVNLAGEEAIGTFAQLEVLMSQWRRITSLLEGPYLIAA